MVGTQENTAAAAVAVASAYTKFHSTNKSEVFFDFHASGTSEQVPITF